MFTGQCIKLSRLDGDIAQLVFDRQGETINKLDRTTLLELARVVALLAADSSIRGVLVSSAKDKFIVGADIKEFGELFSRDDSELDAHMKWANRIFCDFEDLPVPSVVAINGMALGGGLEFALSGTLRMMADDALIGLPEVSLGLFPGYGGTVRLSRLAGAEVAVDWIVSGKPRRAAEALAGGVVDAVSPADLLLAQAAELLRQAISGEIDADACRRKKLGALPGDKASRDAIFSQALARLSKSIGQHQPAARMAVEALAQGADCVRDGALDYERQALIRVAKTQAADAMIQAFHNQQALKKLFNRHRANARPVKAAAVLGAGIMGGGIAYTSASKGVPVRLKDISQGQLDLGIAEASKQIGRQIKSGRLSEDKGQKVLASILPQLDYAGFADRDVVVEAVVENLKIKHAVLAELETVVGPNTIIASNTSSLRIDEIAAPLQRPESFVGMHFFNPVPVMALVEIIKGSRTSEVAVSTAVDYAVSMGKTPIVVQDCPGFLVNRILTPYVRAFIDLVADGVDFVRIDRVMEDFGWPMGPAYLMDVVGIDTGCHVFDVISAGYPEHMPKQERNALAVMVANKRYGQKNGIGFYRYENDPNGKPKKTVAEDSYQLLKSIQSAQPKEVSDQEISERMMLSSILEAARALEGGVVATAGELDVAMLLGIGYPPYLGGPLKYVDWLGLPKIVELGEKYAHLGPQYRVTEKIRQMAAGGVRFYG
ncbi:fatty acid oxidation complex subunit alpha FadB [Dechloromonas denitrificans]|uniref:fatty acid oxidation complex subunit alpha FadB n=1 Tax=Dechloromonas denitrificans TaxID=281362 RepID=UPI001CF8D2EE|nr:fatty acid oxidation complex subunit alpha FadB [Dechloromonas denitrificans]UCV02151.1 fatty acid oxidation complex subunit alpha FadB [Dechloromonas denitrificans]